MGELRSTTPTHSNVLNLALTFSLSAGETSLLDKGLLFIPTPSKVDKQALRRDLHAYHRRLKLLERFGYRSDTTREPFTLPSNWEPEEEAISEPLRELIGEDVEALNNLPRCRFPQNNLTNEERQALINLKNNKGIVIKPADKGSKIVIQDRSGYLLEAYRQLENKKHYLPLEKPIQSETQEKVREILDNLHTRKYITFKQLTYLYGDDPPRRRKFYLLPKIHKDPSSWTVPHRIPPGRPIVSDCGSESYQVAEYLDSFLNPLSQKHPSYVKDTYTFVNLLKQVKLTPGSFIFSVDVDALYTQINTHLGLQAVRNIFDQYPDPSRPDEELLKLLELGLTCNDFEFNSKFYLQVHGTAMGKKWAGAYANIYLAEWERTVFPKCPKLPTVYLRYLDDIFGVWPHSKTDFADFMVILNNHHEAISLKSDLQPESVNFLDTEVFIREKDGVLGLGTRVYFKPTDTHALLHKSSYHPRHTYKGIIKSQLIRFRRICEAEADVQSATRTLFQALKPTGYSRTFLRGINKEVKESFARGFAPAIREDRNQNLIPLITTFTPSSVSLNSSIKTNFGRLQESVEQLQDFRVIAAFRKNKNLKDVLVQASLPAHRPKRDPLAPYFKTLRYITNPHTNLSSPVWGDFSLDSKNLIYGIQCKVCLMWYIGQTKNPLKQRLKQHLYCIRHPHRNRILYDHFQAHGHENLQISGLEKGTNWSLRKRLWKERMWIKKLNCLFPSGLNEAL